MAIERIAKGLIIFMAREAVEFLSHFRTFILIVLGVGDQKADHLSYLHKNSCPLSINIIGLQSTKTGRTKRRKF